MRMASPFYAQKALRSAAVYGGVMRFALWLILGEIVTLDVINARR